MATTNEGWRSILRRKVAAFLWRCAAPRAEEWPSDQVIRWLGQRFHSDDLGAWLESVDEAPPTEPLAIEYGLDRLVPPGPRRTHGVYFTPEPLAEKVVGWGGESVSSIFDPAAGEGALLAAAHRSYPTATIYAVERDLDLALAVAARLDSLGADFEVWAGDGLDASIGPKEVDLVVMNPPYLGEKGNREVFAALKAEHPRLADAFTPRTDLSNLFLYGGLERLKPGGRLVALTTEYWLQSDAASPIRRAIADDFALVGLERFGAGLFKDAPGHHSLISTVEAAHTDRRTFMTIDDGAREVHPCDMLREERWNPFVADVVREGPTLGSVARTSQGFVSGADRVTARHLRLAPGCGEMGDPIFLFEDEPPPELSRWTEPVLRGSQIVGGETIERFEPLVWVLWLDAEVDEDEAAPALRHLTPFRPILERRREARTGAMPWYRLHWPRDRESMKQPKLVTPRRAARPTFGLDLTGAAVSSDCTWICAPADVEDGREWLEDLQAELQSDEVERWLRRHGKTKGNLIEFYAGPLESLPLPKRFARG